MIAVVVLGGAVAWWAQRNAKVRWAREQALPEIIRLAGTDKFDEAFRLAEEARQYIPNDTLLAEQIRAVARTATIDSEPSGADVFYRPYGRPDEAWRPLGRTPIKEASVPRGTAALEGRTGRLRRRRRCRAGSVLAAPFPLQAPAPGTSARQGWSAWSRPTSRFSCSSRGSITCSPSALPDYWIDQREVTNRDFKRFVDDGGYRRAEFWREPFVKDGRPIAFDAAMALFVDTTGRPGPATWEQGAYPDGQDDYPGDAA